LLTNKDQGRKYQVKKEKKSEYAPAPSIAAAKPNGANGLKSPSGEADSAAAAVAAARVVAKAAAPQPPVLKRPPSLGTLAPASSPRERWNGHDDAV
jgi:hypothetical protein